MIHTRRSVCYAMLVVAHCWASLSWGVARDDRLRVLGSLLGVSLRSLGVIVVRHFHYFVKVVGCSVENDLST